MTTSTAQILRAFRWNAIGRIGAQIVSWAITIQVMRLLTPVDYGLVAIAAIAMGLCLLVNDLGAIPALIQQRDIEKGLVQKIFGFVLVTNAAIYALLYFGAPYFADFFSDGRLVELLRILGLSLIVQALGSVPNAMLQRELKFKALSIVDFISTLIGSGTTLLLAFLGFGVWSLIFGGIAKTASKTLGVIGVARFRTMPSFDFSGLRTILSFGMKFSGSSLIWYFNRTIDGALIGRLLGAHALGLYSVANNLALMPSSKVMQVNNQVAFSAYSRVQDDHERLRKYYLESARVASFIFFPVCWGMSVVSSDFVDLLLGPKWHAGAILLQILTIGIPYRALTLLMEPLVNGLGAPGIILKNTLTTAAIIPIALVAGIQWGLIGLCIAALIGTILATTINLGRDLAFVRMTYREVASVCWGAMIAAGIMYLAVFAAQGTLLAPLPIFMRLPADVALGATVYVVITLAINRQAALRSIQIMRGTV